MELKMAQRKLLKPTADKLKIQLHHQQFPIDHILFWWTGKLILPVHQKKMWSVGSCW